MSETTMTGLHVAIIMDGNGRWATARGLPRTAGHRQGAEAVRRTVEAAPGLGVGTLTLYAFSSDNWSRPAAEVRTLFRLFRRYLRSETDALVENGVRLKVVGRRDRIPGDLVAEVERAEARTASSRRLLLRVALDYSARDAIVAAAQRLPRGEPATREAFTCAMGQALNADGPVQDVDLLIRTGGEQRLSDFMLWESAYAELVFTPRMWPDFDGDDLRHAVEEFARRDRRFGSVLRVG
jgi:undecaprenyl diphosphate synthase